MNGKWVGMSTPWSGVRGYLFTVCMYKQLYYYLSIYYVIQSVYLLRKFPIPLFPVRKYTLKSMKMIFHGRLIQITFLLIFEYKKSKSVYRYPMYDHLS